MDKVFKLAAICFVQEKFLIARLCYEIGLQLDPRNQNVANIEELVHDSVICDGCQNQMKRLRFKCQNCDDYDLCKTCYQRRLELHSHMDFLQIPNEST